MAPVVAPRAPVLEADSQTSRIRPTPQDGLDGAIPVGVSESDLVVRIPPVREGTTRIRIRSRAKGAPRLLPPYREHLSQAFARFLMRVGLPVDIPHF